MARPATIADVDPHYDATQARFPSTLGEPSTRSTRASERQEANLQPAPLIPADPSAHVTRAPEPQGAGLLPPPPADVGSAALSLRMDQLERTTRSILELLGDIRASLTTATTPPVSLTAPTLPGAGIVVLPAGSPHTSATPRAYPTRGTPATSPTSTTSHRWSSQHLRQRHPPERSHHDHRPSSSSLLRLPSTSVQLSWSPPRRPTTDVV